NGCGRAEGRHGQAGGAASGANQDRGANQAERRPLHRGTYDRETAKARGHRAGHQVCGGACGGGAQRGKKEGGRSGLGARKGSCTDGALKEDPMSNPTMRPMEQTPLEFWLRRDNMVNHPNRDGYYVLWNGPVFLDVGVAFGTFERFPLGNFPNGVWVDLQD